MCCVCVLVRDALYNGTGKLPVYILYFKRYDIIILLNSVFHVLLLQSSPAGGSAPQIARGPQRNPKQTII